MSNLAKVMSKQVQPGLKLFKKGGKVLQEGSKKEEEMDRKEGVKKACGGKVKK